MSFRKLSESFPEKEIFYNSKESEFFRDLYMNNRKKDLIPDEVYIPSKRFSPSSIRCNRLNWFRLRGAVPEVNTNPDVTLDFIADIGTHCHETFQKNLQRYLGDNWIDVEDYLLQYPPKFEYTLKKIGMETRVTIVDPPVGFACDGIIKLDDNKLYLLEIKTSESKSMKNLVGAKSEHIDQIICYCTLLGIDDAMIVYIDRQYGGIKCFTKHITDNEKSRILDKFEIVQAAVKSNIAPEGLPPNDKWCNPNYCNYYRLCKQWGR